MKPLGNFLFWFIILLVSSNLVLGAITYAGKFKFGDISSIDSPIPKLLSGFSENSSKGKFWQPNLVGKASAQTPLDITAVSAMSYNDARCCMRRILKPNFQWHHSQKL